MRIDFECIEFLNLQSFFGVRIFNEDCHKQSAEGRKNDVTVANSENDKIVVNEEQGTKDEYFHARFAGHERERERIILQ